MMANYYAMLRDRSQALKHLQEALNLNPNTPEYLAIAAVVHNQSGEKDQALEWLEKARARGFPRRKSGPLQSSIICGMSPDSSQLILAK